MLDSTLLLLQSEDLPAFVIEKPKWQVLLLLLPFLRLTSTTPTVLPSIQHSSRSRLTLFSFSTTNLDFQGGEPCDPHEEEDFCQPSVPSGSRWPTNDSTFCTEIDVLKLLWLPAPRSQMVTAPNLDRQQALGPRIIIFFFFCFGLCFIFRLQWPIYRPLQHWPTSIFTSESVWLTGEDGRLNLIFWDFVALNCFPRGRPDVPLTDCGRTIPPSETHKLHLLCGTLRKTHWDAHFTRRISASLNRIWQDWFFPRAFLNPAVLLMAWVFIHFACT